VEYVVSVLFDSRLGGFSVNGVQDTLSWQTCLMARLVLRWFPGGLPTRPYPCDGFHRQWIQMSSLMFCISGIRAAVTE
jgi:hypothetical protein